MTNVATASPRSFGVLGSFPSPEQLTQAANAARAAGYRKMDAYSPFPIPQIPAALGRKPTRLPWIILAGGVFGALTGLALQYFTSAVTYPINVGNRPYAAWPAFMVVTFELTILGAALAAVLGMLALNRLPMPYHPLFNVPDFVMASRNRFFLCIESADPNFEPIRAAEFLRGAGATEVFDVPL